MTPVMRTNTLLGTVIGLLLLVGLVVGGWFLLSGRTKQSGTPGQLNVNVPEHLQNLEKLLAFRSTVPPDDRVVLFGNSLVQPPADIIRARLGEELKRPVEVVSLNGTSQKAVVEVKTILQKPPKQLVLDLGRFDAAEGVEPQDTVANIGTIVTTATKNGVEVVVIGGVGSDGDIQFASFLRSIAEPPAKFVDASTLLLSGAYRDSPTVLNREGTNRLAGLLVETLR